MKIRRLFTAGAATVAALGLALTACTSPANTIPSSSAPAGSDTTSAAKTYTIGVAVIMSHPALQAVQDGFEEVLKEQGLNYTLISKNAQGDSSAASTIASTFAADKSIDLVLAISTPIATAMASAIQDRPILFSAVTDPVSVNLVPSWTQAGPNITGTSDMNSDAKPVTLVQQAMPNVKTIGVLYTSSEANSLTQVKAYEDEAKSLGVTLKEQAITTPADIGTGLAALAGVDAILVPTDNTVVASLGSVIQFGQEKQIPVFCADTTTVAMGTVAARGLSYHDLGRATGDMAVKILRDGVDISTIPPEAPTTTELDVNPAAAATFGLTLPASFTDGATIVQTQSS